MTFKTATTPPLQRIGLGNYGCGGGHDWPRSWCCLGFCTTFFEVPVPFPETIWLRISPRASAGGLRVELKYCPIAKVWDWTTETHCGGTYDALADWFTSVLPERRDVTVYVTLYYR